MPGYSTIFDEIIFVEGAEPDSRLLEQISCVFSFKLGAQLKNLNDVKRSLAQQAKSVGANAVLDFKYGQKSRWFAVDDVAYFGSGVAAMISDAKYREIKEKIENR